MVERCLDKAKMEVQFFQLLPSFIIAVWSGWLARQPHKLEVVSSSLTTAINFILRAVSSDGRASDF